MATDASTLAGRYRLDAPEPDVGLYDTWRATDLTRDLPVRVERLPRPVAADLTEHLRSLRALSDVGLVPALDGGLDGDGAFLVTERDDGQRSLAHWLAGHRAAATLPSPATVQRLFDRVGAALRFVHESRGPLRAHGGLTARTVLLRRVGALHAVRLLDLGALHLVAPADASAAWERATPYLPLAQAPGAPASVAHDLFALAVLHLELLTARAAAAPNETWSLAARGGVERVQSLLREARDDVPPALVAALVRALAPNASARFPSAAALTKAVRDAWAAAGLWATPGAREPEPPVAEALPARPSVPAPARVESAVPVGWRAPERAPAPTVEPPPPPDDPPRPRTVRVDALDTEFNAPAAPLGGDATRVRAKSALAEPPPAVEPEAPEDAPPLDEPGHRTVLAPTVFTHDDDDDEGATRALTRAGDLFAAELALASQAAPQRPPGTSAAPPLRAPLAPPREALSPPVDEVSLTEQIAPGDLLAVRAALAPHPEENPTDPVGLPAAVVVPSAAPLAPAAAPLAPPAPPPPRPAGALAPPRPEVIAGVVLAVSLLALALAWAIR